MSACYVKLSCSTRIAPFSDDESSLRALYERWRKDWPAKRCLLDFWNDSISDETVLRLVGKRDTVRLYVLVTLIKTTTTGARHQPVSERSRAVRLLYARVRPEG